MIDITAAVDKFAGGLTRRIDRETRSYLGGDMTRKMASSGDITAAIVTKDRPTFLSKCLISLSNQSVLPSEILVVDNGSSRKVDSLCRRLSKNLPIRYAYNKTPSQPKARNIALDESSSQFLAFIDDDCEADRNWIGTLEKAHYAHPESVAIQGKIASRQSNTVSQTSTLQCLNNILMGYFQSGNLSLNLTELNKLNIRFNESLLSSYDLDLALQLQQKNGAHHYAEEAVIYHHYGFSLFREIKRYFNYGFWDHKLKKLHHDKGMCLPNSKHFMRLLIKADLSSFNKISVFCYYLVSTLVSYSGYLTAGIRSG